MATERPKFRLALCAWRRAFSALSGLMVWSAVCLLAAPAFAQLRVGEVVEVSIESPHPYPNGTKDRPAVWSHTIRHPGATFVKIHFATFGVEGSVEKGKPKGDYVAIKDGDGVEHEVLSGTYTEDLWSRSVPGDTVTIELHADEAGSAFGLIIDRYGYGTVPLYPQKNASTLPHPESICGIDEKNAICQAVVPERIRLSDPVGRILYADDCGGFFLCTAFLFSADGKLMTNAHCANSRRESRSMEAWFNYINDTTPGGACSVSGRPNPDIFKSKKFLQKNCNLDVAVHLILDPVKGNPADLYGHLSLSSRKPEAGEEVWIPQHAGGRRKETSEVDAAVSTPSAEGINFCADPPGGCSAPGFFTGRPTEFGYTADTEPGSSGSPVLDQNNQVIGLHHAGGCDASGGENFGIQMSAILPALGKPPKARFTTEPRRRGGKAPFAVMFDGSRSYDPDSGDITKYRWDFGDGSPVVEGPEAIVTHTYTSPGRFKARLQVVDEEGMQSDKAAEKTVRVKEEKKVKVK